ncbi:MAG: hypothetical protein ACXADS_10305 [Candidatus Thorarchaeota archaeon]
MSGGKFKPDPYYQKDPPKKSKGEKEESLPRTYRNAVKPVRTVVGPDGKKEFYYRCEHCGGVFKDDKRKKHRRAFHDKKCQYEWQKYGQEKHSPTPEQRKEQSRRFKRMWQDSERKRRHSEAMKKRWADPEFRRRMTKRMREVAQDPEWRRRVSKAAKEVASRPEWKEKQSKAHKGKKRPPEVGDKISRAKMGHPVSKETREKLADAARGDKSYFWRGGISGERQRFYRSWQWRMQSERVMNRDNHTCQGCGWTKSEVEKRDEKMGVHHMKALDEWGGDGYDYPDDLLTTLCQVCHGKSEYQDGDLKRPTDGRGDDAKLDRLKSQKSKQSALDDFD